MDALAALMGKSAWADSLHGGAANISTSGGDYTLTNTTTAVPATYYTASTLK